VNAGARVLYSMGRHGIFHCSVGSTHEEHQTPHVAVTVVTVLSTGPTVVLMALGHGLFDIYGWVGTIATFGFLLNYVLIAIAAPAYIHREKELSGKDLVLSAVTVLVLSIPIAGSIYPVPPAPYAYFPWIFLGWLLAGGLWFHARKRFSPRIFSDIEVHIEDIHRRYKVIRESAD